MDYDKFKNLTSTEKWFYVFTSLKNHLSQIKEVKWLLRIILAGVIGWIIKGAIIG